MRQFCALVLIILGFIACERPYVEKPSHLISKSDMIEILEDLYLTQQMVNSSPSKSGNNILDIANNAKYILDEHEVSPQEFEDSYKYYFTQPSVYQKMLDKVKNNLKDRFSDEELQHYEEINSQK